LSTRSTVRGGPAAVDGLAVLVERTKRFVAEQVLPIDGKHDGDVEAAGGEVLRVTLQAAAREAGLLSPHGPADCGGLGLGMVDRAPVFEAAGYSLFGPMALNINAPDEGNVHLLDHVATLGQRDRYLRPLVRGEVRSAFAMTEPGPGAGSDPSLLTTTATRVSDGWVINGAKRFITGADGAAFYIIMARTGAEPGSAEGATMFSEIRPFRIYDSPSEVHRWSIAKRAIRRSTAFGGR
jgi:acyl-CoA dehydrogenase